jgi:hypothetical protein
VSVGFPALEFVRHHIDEILPGVPVVFVSVEARRIQGSVFPPNITGVVHDDDWGGALAEILRMQPDLGEVVVVGGSAASDHESSNEKKILFQPYTSKVNFRYFTDFPYSIC